MYEINAFTAIIGFITATCQRNALLAHQKATEEKKKGAAVVLKQMLLKGRISRTWNQRAAKPPINVVPNLPTISKSESALVQITQKGTNTTLLLKKRHY